MTYTIHLPLVSKSKSKIGLAGFVAKGASSVFGHATGVYQNWSSSSTRNLSENAQHIPTIWSNKRTLNGKVTDYFDIAGKVLPKDYSGDLLVLNEPRLKTQANKSPSEAVDIFRWTRIAYPSAKIYFPQFALDNPEECLRWYSEFVIKYFNTYNEKPKVEGIGVHVYTNTVHEVDYLVSKFTDSFKDSGLKFIVSEFGVTWSRDELYSDNSEYTDNLKELGVFDDYLSKLSEIPSQTRAEEIMRYYSRNKNIKYALYFMNAPDDFSKTFSPVWLQCGQYYDQISGTGKAWLKFQ